MSSLDLVNNLFVRMFPCKLPMKEKAFLELLLFANLYRELIIHYEINSESEKESTMVNNIVLRNIVNDLLGSDDYTLQGLANYIGYPEEVIYDLALGTNTNPTISLSTKIIELHMIARRDFYNQIINKLFVKFASGKIE